MEPVGPHGEVIMDYSIHDAIEAGFSKIIFVIRRDIEDAFRAAIGNQIEQNCAKLGVTVEYAYQSIDDIPQGAMVPEGRTKPWGTGQAVLAAKKYICGPFAAINADDYYGKEAFQKLYSFLAVPHYSDEYCMAGFVLKNTLSDHGSVTRGICQVANGMLVNVVETPGIIKTNVEYPRVKKRSIRM